MMIIGTKRSRYPDSKCKEQLEISKRAKFQVIMSDTGEMTLKIISNVF